MSQRLWLSPFPKELPQTTGCRSVATASRLALRATAHAAAALTQPRQTGGGCSSRKARCASSAQLHEQTWNGGCATSRSSLTAERTLGIRMNTISAEAERLPQPLLHGARRHKAAQFGEQGRLTVRRMAHLPAAQRGEHDRGSDGIGRGGILNVLLDRP